MLMWDDFNRTGSSMQYIPELLYLYPIIERRGRKIVMLVAARVEPSSTPHLSSTVNNNVLWNAKKKAKNELSGGSTGIRTVKKAL
ncbi:hypothetical protein KIN20_032715 [Parelaphostrongylus tenuis]|uniref:Uncharacterized protein n=1 Tax=Parelaphostrongylus tenuis TaxID=148309 RepID=A0AAD5R7M4_PARTN|nr:hypothetical protein KIN20_032715 [Parelaphostrongylus tenuis]